MLEHLNDHHLIARYQTDTPADSDSNAMHEAGTVPDDEVARLHTF
jgi:hypothetical protein